MELSTTRMTHLKQLQSGPSEVLSSQIKVREYTEAEKGLNDYIIVHYPEWGCNNI
jgi:hypothetical protein